MVTAGHEETDGGIARRGGLPGAALGVGGRGDGAALPSRSRTSAVTGRLNRSVQRSSNQFASVLAPSTSTTSTLSSRLLVNPGTVRLDEPTKPVIGLLRSSRWHIGLAVQRPAGEYLHLDLLIALNSGLPGMCSLHANSAREALVKMCTLPLLAGENVSAALVVGDDCSHPNCRARPGCEPPVRSLRLDRHGLREGPRAASPSPRPLAGTSSGGTLGRALASRPSRGRRSPCRRTRSTPPSR